MNQVFLIGRLVNDVELIKAEDGKEYGRITLAVSRSYKNEEGIYETDFIDCVVWNHVAKNFAEYSKKGDLISVKGSIQTSIFDDKETGKSRKSFSINVEKVVFLASKNIDNKKIEENER